MFDVNIAILYPSERLKSLPKRSDAGLHLGIMLGKCVQKHDPPHPRRSLRTRRNGPRRRAAEQRDELASRHHSITSSARASKIGEISKPKALAVLRLITNSNLVPCWIGKSDGFAPLRMLSTKVAKRYHMSLRLTE